jgi:hypothetical protein
MLTGILSRVLGGRTRSTGMRRTTSTPTAGRPATGAASRDVERGARSIFRAFSRRRGI